MEEEYVSLEEICGRSWGEKAEAGRAAVVDRGLGTLLLVSTAHSSLAVLGALLPQVLPVCIPNVHPSPPGMYFLQHWILYFSPMALTTVADKLCPFLTYEGNGPCVCSLLRSQCEQPLACLAVCGCVIVEVM